EIANAPLRIAALSPGAGKKLIGCFDGTKKPAPMSAAIRSNFTSVEAFWNALPTRKFPTWKTVTIQTTTNERTTGEPTLKTPLKYCPKAIAASATGPTTQTVADTNPAMNPSAG